MKFGRKPRGHDTRIPQLSALLAHRTMAPIPGAIDYGTGTPANLGMMLNDTLSDCVPAGAGHSIQIWTFHGRGVMVTPSDPEIEQFYEEAGGYVPGKPNTD